MGRRQKIAVKVTNWVGDVVMNLPALQVIRDNHPDAEIVAIARPWVKNLFAFRSDLVDRVIIFDDKKISKSPTKIRELIKTLSAESFDMGIALTRHLKGAALLWAAGIPVRVGFSTIFSRPFLTHPMSRKVLPKNRHQSMNYVDLLTKMTHMKSAGDIAPRLNPDPVYSAELREKFLPNAKGPLLVIHPGAAYGTAKRWFPERFAAVTQQFLEEFNGSAVVLGIESERDMCDPIAAGVNHPGFFNLCGACDLKESIGLTSLAEMVMTNDSGMMHVAGAFGVPQVAIFGPTDINATFPLNPQARLFHHPVACSPCKHRHCPIGHDCMKAVTTEEVYAGVLELLRKNFNTEINQKTSV